jgi:hypothetical protein
MLVVLDVSLFLDVRELDVQAPTIRVGSLIAAGVVAIAGVLLALMILWMFNDSPLRS